MVKDVFNVPYFSAWHGGCQKQQLKLKFKADFDTWIKMRGLPLLIYNSKMHQYNLVCECAGDKVFCPTAQNLHT
jgi:hypothetical protein